MKRARSWLCHHGWHRVHVETVTYMDCRRVWCTHCRAVFLVAEGVG